MNYKLCSTMEGKLLKTKDTHKNMKEYSELLYCKLTVNTFKNIIKTMGYKRVFVEWD